VQPGFDDTQRQGDVTYVDGRSRRDVEWLGNSCGTRSLASDNFERLYQFAVELSVRAVLCDSLNADEIRRIAAR